MAVNLLGTTRISWTSFSLKTPNVFAFPEWGGAELVCMSHTFSNPKTHPLVVLLVPSAAIEVLHHIQGLQKGWVPGSLFLSSASTKPSRIDCEGGAEPFEHTLCSSGEPSDTIKQGTQKEKWRRDIEKTEEQFLPDVPVKYSHCIYSCGGMFPPPNLAFSHNSYQVITTCGTNDGCTCSWWLHPAQGEFGRDR